MVKNEKGHNPDAGPEPAESLLRLNRTLAISRLLLMGAPVPEIEAGEGEKIARVRQTSMMEQVGLLEDGAG